MIRRDWLKALLAAPLALLVRKGESPKSETPWDERLKAGELSVNDVRAIEGLPPIEEFCESLGVRMEPWQIQHMTGELARRRIRCWRRR